MDSFVYVLQNYLLLGLSLTKEIEYELYRYDTLLDPACNKFEVIVDKKHGKMCFTQNS